jgi:peptidoglycan/LPS O-acetylase OafA/YrhL
MPSREASTPTSGSGDDKLIGIELLRFASALAVLVFHYQHFAFVGTSQVNFNATDQPFYAALKLFYVYGFYGVQVFWCISGFIFFWKYGATITRRQISGYKFFILRFSRLYPLHLATLLFVAILQFFYFQRNGAYYIYPNNDLLHFVLQIFMASNWSVRLGESFNGPIWSISIEVLAYFIFFFSLRYISGSTAFICAVALSAAAVLFLKISEHPLFTCVMFFYIGCLTAILYARVQSVAKRRRLATIGAVGAIAAVTALQFFVLVKPIYFLLILSPALIFLFVTYMPSNARLSSLLVVAGSTTYSSYLLHVPIQLAAVSIAGYAHWSMPMYTSGFFFGFLGITLLLSYYCYLFFEMPMQSYLRRRFK